MKATHHSLAFLMAAALSVSSYAADVVTSGDVESVRQWYGHAGGLAGSDRVGGLRVGSSKVGVTYDPDVAARTNMQRSQMEPASVGVTYDPDVAARTNMPRAGKAPATHEAGIDKSN